MKSLPAMSSVALLSLVVLAHTARASGIPSPANSSVPTLIRLVGANGTTPDAASGQFTVVMRDLANNRMPGFPVVLDLSACPDLILCSAQMDPSTVVDCAARTVSKITDASGGVTFTLLGHSTGAGHTLSLAGSAKLFGNRVLMGSPSVATFDLDGTGGVGAGDLSAWLGDFGSGTAWQRSDFDGDGQITANDLSAWISVFGAGSSTQSCGLACP